jgi:hypothetical protein
MALFYKNTNIKISKEIQKLYAILIIKGSNAADFNMWLTWYEKFIKCDKIIILNDDSELNISDYIKNYNNIVLINGLYSKTNQITNYNIVISDIIKPNINDIIIIPDFDEFWWYDSFKFNSFKECVMHDFIKFKTHSLGVPWTNMMSKNLLATRPENMNYNDLCKFRINVAFIEMKPVILYDNNNFDSVHHGLKNFETITTTDVFDIDNRHKLFARTIYDYYLRLYHYRITTIDEYNNKIKTSLIKQNLINNKRYYMDSNIEDYLTKSKQFPYMLDLTVDSTLKYLK